MEIKVEGEPHTSCIDEMTCVESDRLALDVLGGACLRV